MKKKIESIDGEQFMCAKHEMDYRIFCDECQKKSNKFNKALDLIIKKENEKDNL